MNAPVTFGQIDEMIVRRQVAGLRQEIALVKQKRNGLDAAIKAREDRIARLEAQLPTPGRTAQPAQFVIARAG